MQKTAGVSDVYAKKPFLPEWQGDMIASHHFLKPIAQNRNSQ